MSEAVATQQGLVGKYRPYPEYNDSGVEWLGGIPNHWISVQSRRLFSLRNTRARAGDRQLAATQKYGVIFQDIFMELEGRRVVQVQIGAEILKHVEPGDFVISMRSFQGGIEYCPYAGCVSSAYVPLTPIKWVHPDYFRYLFKSSPYIQALQSTSNLVRDGQALRFENFSLVDLPVVPIDEQRTIAAFLDYETARIDRLIAQQQRLIELLKEKRQAVISHAVTKGLNPNALMKDSGVEWLGQVPEHWDVPAIKYIVSTPITDGPHETPDFLDSGVPFISAEAISGGFIDFDKKRACISVQDNARYSKKYSPRKNDIYMVKSGATTGVTAIVETDDEFNIWSPLAAIRCNSTSNPYFVLNFLRSRNFLEAIELNWSFGTQQNIGMGVIENLHVTRPPLGEAILIADYINKECTKFGLIIERAEAMTRLLQERRIALISAAVTGKIDLRGWTPPTDSEVAA